MVCGLFCYHFNGFSPFLELRYCSIPENHMYVHFFFIYEWFVPIFVILLMGNRLFLSFFYSRSSLVSFFPIFRSFFLVLLEVLFLVFIRSFVPILLIQKFTCDPTESFIYYCKSVLHLLKCT